MIEKYLSALEEEIAQTTFGHHPEELYAPLGYIMRLGGKRLRPALVLMAYNLFQEDWQKQLKPALAVEVFHNFTLLHDDIMDGAPMRRGQATVHEKWDTNTAILSGDVMLVAAYELLGKMPSGDFKQAFTRFNKTAAEVCEGQQLDMLYAKRNNVRAEDYLEMIRLKTSVLLGFALELGGICAGVDPSVQKELHSIGVAFGLGFQIKDDILDVFGDQAKVGKQVGGDILENKKTWLMIRALEWSESTENGKKLRDWITKKEFNPDKKVAEVRAIYQALKVDSKAEELAEHYFLQGFEGIKRLQAPEERKANLIAFGRYLQGRDN